MSWPGVYRVFWIIIFGALLAVGAPTIFRSKASLPLVERGPDSSVNSVLLQTLGEPALAPQLTEWLNELPRGHPILVLAAPDHLAASFTADLISYLAWPRPVVVSTGRDQSQKLLRNFREHYSALGLCYLPPPPGVTPHKSFGAVLTFTLSQPGSQ